MPGRGTPTAAGGGPWQLGGIHAAVQTGGCVARPSADHPALPVDLRCVAGCKSSLELIEQAVKTKETRFVARAMRQTAGARKGMNLAALTMILGQMPESELQSLVFKHVSAIEEPAPMAVRCDTRPSRPTPLHMCHFRLGIPRAHAAPY